MVANVSSGLTQGNDFGVGSGIVLTDVAIPASAHDTACADDDSSHWYFAGTERALSAA